MKKIDLNGKTILVTGAAGFIGSNLVKRLFKELKDATIVGIDNMNDYYDVALKEYRLKDIESPKSKVQSQRPTSDLRPQTLDGNASDLRPHTLDGNASDLRPQTFDNKWIFIKADIADKPTIDKIFDEYRFDVVVNLAAQAGVRYSITNPDAYIQSNSIGFYNILEACRDSVKGQKSKVESQKSKDEGQKSALDLRPQTFDGNASDLRPQTSDGNASDLRPQTYQGVQHLIYASSSSVYGGNKKVPFSTDDRVDNPVSLYAATKKSNELMAHCYSELYNIPSTGLRFFTVYGPAGRPDMAYFGFTNKLLKGETIQIFNYGNCRRDFTYVDDIVEGIWRVMQRPPASPSGEGRGEAVVYNIGGGQPENLLDFVNILQEELVRAGVLPQDFDFEAHKQLVPMQPGDVPTTYADSTALERDFGFTPKITLREGLRKFAEWYAAFYTR